MQQTKNYKFKKPELIDSPPDITVTNPNWDLVDKNLKEAHDKAKDWDTFKKDGGAINGPIRTNRVERVLPVNTIEPGYGFGIGVKSANGSDTMDVILGNDSGYKSLYPSKKGISLGNPAFKFLDQYLEGDSFATRHVGGNPTQDKRYRLSVDDAGNFAIQKMKSNGTWLYNVLVEAKGEIGLAATDLYFGNSSRTENGYTKLPNGLIIQWGTFWTSGINAGNSVNGKVNLPIAFPNKALILTVSAELGRDPKGVYLYNAKFHPVGCYFTSKSTFDYKIQAIDYIGGSAVCNFIAIGY